MPEAYQPSLAKIKEIAGQATFPLESPVDEVFAVYKPNTWVFRTGEKVHKIRTARTDDEKRKTEKEARNFKSILAFYLLQGHDLGMSTAIAQSGFSVLTMPYLGVSLHVIGQELDLVREGYESDKIPDVAERFTDDVLVDLVETFEQDLSEFRGMFGLVHCDLAQNNAPNNIVYNARLHRLLPIDAEAFTLATPESSFISQGHIAAVKQWLEI